jgi:predicted ATPase
VLLGLPLAGDREAQVRFLDDASAQLLEHLLPLIRTAPLLLMCTTRPQPAGPPARLMDAARREVADRLAEVRLAPLSAAASSELVGEAFGPSTLPSAAPTR